MNTYICNDGNAEIEITAETPQEAAQEYVDGGEWGDITETDWVTVRVTEITPAIAFIRAHEDDNAEEGKDAEDDYRNMIRLVCGREPTEDEDTQEMFASIVAVTGEPDSRRIKIALEPDEPECEAAEHDWQSPIEIVGGIKENPGVWGHGGGVTITEVCMSCGTERVTDTWAQDMSDGEQGLESVSYDPNKYADEIASLTA